MSKSYKIFLYCCFVAFGLFFTVKYANATKIRIIQNEPVDTPFISTCLDTFQFEILITNDTTVNRTSEVLNRTSEVLNRTSEVLIRSSEVLNRSSEVLIRSSEVLIRSSEVLIRSSEVLKHIKQA